VAMACTMKVFGARAVPARPAARCVAAQAAARPLWLPGMNAPSHLDGSMAGDFGFDPLCLGKQGPERLKWCDAQTTALAA
jgi:Chlorophyll A-B binding protein